MFVYNFLKKSSYKVNDSSFYSVAMYFLNFCRSTRQKAHYHTKISKDCQITEKKLNSIQNVCLLLFEKVELESK